MGHPDVGGSDIFLDGSCHRVAKLLSKGVEFAVYVGARGARMSAACPSVRMHERACCRAWSLRCLPCARRRDGGVGEVLPRLTTSHVLLLATRAARARDTN